jgi:hypothetical protein
MEFKECPDVRLATPEDIPEIIRLFREYLKENNQNKFNEEKLVEIISLHYKKNGGIIGVVGKEGRSLDGMTILVVQQSWYSDDFQLQELILYIDQGSRKSSYAKQLMIFAKKATELLDLELRIGVWSSERTEAKMKLYGRQFNFRGGFFSWNEKSKV